MKLFNINDLILLSVYILMVKINGEIAWMNRFDVSTWQVAVQIKVSDLFLYLNIGVEVLELIVEWTILTQNPPVVRQD